jgi:uncharacterized tellurite resistance protein B-like protein
MYHDRNASSPGEEPCVSLSTPSLNLALGRVLIAAAWSDGELTEDERASLLDLLFRLPGLTAKDWKTLEGEIATAVDEAERSRRLSDLKAAVRTPEDRGQVVGAIEELTAQGTPFSDQDRSVLEGIIDEIDTSSPGVLTRLATLMREPMERRAKAIAGFFHQESEFENDVRQRIERAVRARFAAEGHQPELSTEDFHKLCLAGGIMARVANVDEVITKGEYSLITDALREGWDLELPWAALVAEIAVSEVSRGLDTYVLVREFFHHTTERERIRFLDVLFSVAEADGHVSHAEIAEIRKISKGFLLSHRHFIAAKTQVPPQRRDD